MAVIGSTLGLPKVADAMNMSLTTMLIAWAASAGLIWLVVDYARMLLLHRKMVSASKHLLTD